VIARQLPWRQLRRRPGRHLLAVLALMLALIAAGVLLVSFALVQRATRDGYAASLPAHATLRLQAGQRFDPATLPPHAQLAASRLRRGLSVSLQLGALALPAQLVSYDDPLHPSIARLRAEDGAWPAPAGQLLLERSAPSAQEFGERLQIGDQELRVAGRYRDVSLPPGWMEGYATLLAGPGVLQRLGAEPGFDEWELRLHGRPDRAAVRRVVGELRDALQRQGLVLRAVDIPEPGVHRHAAQMDSLLFTQAAMALLTLLACGFLVHNVFATLLREQLRELALMKTLGASGPRLAGLALAPALLAGLLATLLALPPSLWLGERYAAFKLDMLNFPAGSAWPPAWVPALLLLTGLLVPLLAAALPLRQALRMPIAAALRHGALQTAAPRLRLPWRGPRARLLQIGLGQLLRHRVRSSLTVLALALAAACFMAASNLRLAVQGAVDEIYAPQRHHLQLHLAERADVSRIEAVARDSEAVAVAEAWTSARGHDDPLEPDVNLLGVPPDSALFQPPVQSGRWLQGGDELVLSRMLRRQRPGWQIGQTLTLTVRGERRSFRVVGEADAGPQPLAWVPRAALGDQSRTLLVSFKRHGTVQQVAAGAQQLRAELETQGLAVASASAQREGRRVVEDHLLMAVQFLSGVGWLLGLVGLLGLAAQLGLSVLEREREIAVLRALGGGNAQIAALLGAELLALLLLAWGLALLLAVPISAALELGFSRMFFRLPWLLWPAPGLAAATLALMALLGLLAAALPLRRSLRIPTARALAA